MIPTYQEDLPPGDFSHPSLHEWKLESFEKEKKL